MLTSSGGSLQWSFAFTAIETGQVSTGQHSPDDIVAVDVHSARSESRARCLRIIERHFVVFRQRRLRGVRTWNETHQSTGHAECGSPDRTIDRTRSYTVETDVDSFVFRRIYRLIRLSPGIASTVAVGVQNKWSPAL